MVPRLLAGKWVPVCLGLLILALALGAQVTRWAPVQQVVQRLELLAYDVRINRLPLPPRQETTRIVIIDVDEQSLREEGRWPWPRDRLGELVRQLANAGVAVVAFDVLFSEPDRNPATEVLEHIREAMDESVLAPVLERAARQLDRDRRFAEQLEDMDVVLGFALQHEGASSTGLLPPPLLHLEAPRQQRLTVLALPRYTANLAALQESAGHAGFLNTTPDLDGTIRRSPLILRHGEGLYASLALEAARLYQLLDDVGIETAAIADREVVEAIRLGRQRIPTDAQGSVLIPYRGTAGSFPTLSAAAVLRGEAEPGQLENTIALVGTSAIGLADLKSTPVQNVFPGVEIQASILDGILNRGFPTQPAWANGADFLAMLLVGLLLALLLPQLGPLWLLLVSLLVMAGWITVNGWLWSRHGLVLNIALPMLMVLMLAIVNMAYGFLFESRRRFQLKHLFGQYVPPQLVEEMSRDPAQYHAEGESREMSVLFADIRSFTTISESLSANDLKDMLNRFFTPMTRIIFEHRGTIDKYVGDMIMAFWGAPLRDEAHAGHAVRAALAMLRQVEAMKPELRALGYPEINIGVGVNTGPMNVGDMGSEFRRAYTVLGDAVNLASRLEGLTKYYGVGLVVGPLTREQAPEFVYRPLDRVKVKGKHEGVEVFEPVCLRDEADETLLREIGDFRSALDLFRSRRWDEAEQALGKLLERYGERRIYHLYRERIQVLRHQDLPTDWDGVFERREK